MYTQIHIYIYNAPLVLSSSKARGAYLFHLQSPTRELGDLERSWGGLELSHMAAASMIGRTFTRDEGGTVPARSQMDDTASRITVRWG